MARLAVITHERSGAVLRSGEFTRAMTGGGATDDADTIARMVDTSLVEHPTPRLQGREARLCALSLSFREAPLLAWGGSAGWGEIGRAHV